VAEGKFFCLKAGKAKVGVIAKPPSKDILNRELIRSLEENIDETIVK
jgi:hypothetical protein